jgi:hypothetical protein
VELEILEIQEIQEIMDRVVEQEILEIREIMVQVEMVVPVAWVVQEGLVDLEVLAVLLGEGVRPVDLVLLEYFLVDLEAVAVAVQLPQVEVVGVVEQVSFLALNPPLH